ncbi:MAG: lipopolysaccharide biosynthesis protein [Solirubrobacteraceae bacterium]|nr:lipopolysaccharide biosynthesis protein [Solirubrobacteraceae bacterium]
MTGVSPTPATAGGPVGDDQNVATRLLRGGGARGAAYVLTNGLAALTAAFLTVNLGTAGFGEYTRIMALGAILLVVCDSGTSNLAARELSEGDPRDRVASIIGLRYGLSGICATLMVLVALLAGWREELVIGTALVGAGLVSAVALTTYLIPSYADLELERVALYELLYPGISSLFVLGAVVADAGVAVILAAQLVVAFPLALLALRKARGRMPLRPVMHPRRIAPLVLEGASFAIAVSIGTLLCNGAQVALGAVADLDTQGVAGLAWRIMVAGLAAAPVLVSGAIPALTAAGADDERLATAVEKLVGLVAAAGGLIAVGAFVAAPTIVALLADETYEGAVDVLRVYAPVAPLTFMAAAGGMALLAVSQHRKLGAANGLAFAVTIGATILAVDLFDEVGLAAGNLAGILVLLAGQVLIWRSMGRSVTPSMAATAKCLAVAAAAIALGALVPVPNLLQIAIAIAAYAAGLIVTRALPPEATGLIARLRPSRG